MHRTCRTGSAAANLECPAFARCQTGLATSSLHRCEHVLLDCALFSSHWSQGGLVNLPLLLLRLCGTSSMPALTGRWPCRVCSCTKPVLLMRCVCRFQAELILACLLGLAAVVLGATTSTSPITLSALTAKSIEGADVPLSKYAGKVLLIVNVASECGYTDSNYKELNELHKVENSAVFPFALVRHLNLRVLLSRLTRESRTFSAVPLARPAHSGVPVQSVRVTGARLRAANQTVLQRAQRQVRRFRQGRRQRPAGAPAVPVAEIEEARRHPLEL